MNLEKVTYLSIVPNESDKKYQDVDSIIKIGNYTSKNLNFGKKIIYTYKEPTIDPQDFEIKIIDKVPYEDFNNYITNFYPDSFETDFMINFHSDGFIQNQNAWDDNFLNYDYIGAPICYPIEKNGFGYILTVGNGGFSLRSKKLCQKIKSLKNNNYMPKYLNLLNNSIAINKDFIENMPDFMKNEDVYISTFCADILNKYGFKCPNLEIAQKFSTEHFCMINRERSVNYDTMINSFGFHEIETSFSEAFNPIRDFRRSLLEKIDKCF